MREGVDAVGNGVPEVVDGPCGGLLEKGLELGEGHLDGIEVGAVGRQETQLRSGRFDGLTDGDRFVRGQIVHDDDIAGFQRRRQNLLHIGHEGSAMHGAIEHQGRGHPFQPERADEGGGLPVPVGNRRPAAFAAPRPSITPRHLGRGPGLVDEDQTLGIEIRLALEPGPPAMQNVRTLLLAGVRGFF